MKAIQEILLVGCGGMFGAISRYGIALMTAGWLQTRLPLGTLIANVLGCFLIGLLIGSEIGESNPKAKLLLGVGFLGSLTTFSTFSAETLQSASDGFPLISAANVIANLLLGFIAVATGIAIARKISGSALGV